MPTRIQRKRTKCFKLPPNTICINRGTMWGNPFTVEEYGRKLAIEVFRQCLQSPHLVYCHFDELEATVQFNRFRWMAENLYLIREADYVACFCPVDVACHGDILIELSCIENAL